MAKFKITKDYTITKLKTDVKVEAMQTLFDALVGVYGEENVSWIRTGGQSKTNEISVICGMAEVDGLEVPVCFTVNASAKDPVDRKTDKKTFEAFDFYKAKADYEAYVAEKAEKDAEKAAKKADKIAKDKKKREENVEF
jgi:hypothetical protein